ALAERGRGFLQLYPGTPGGASVQLLPDHRSEHPEVRVELLVDIAVMTGDPAVTGLREAPLLVQLRIVHERVTAAEDVTQLGHLQPVLFQVDDDRRLLRAELRGGRLEYPAVASGPGRDVNEQPNPGAHLRGPLRAERGCARIARLNRHATSASK